MTGHILAQISSWILSVIQTAGYGGVVFLMTLESFNIPIPSEIIMPFAGFLVAQGAMLFWVVVGAGVVGNLIGSLANYYLGYWGGRDFLEKFGKYFFVHHKDLDRSHVLFEKYGPEIVGIGRVIPVVRTFISLPAGIARMPLGKFVLYTILGALPWNIAMAYLGVYLGDRWESLRVWFEKLDWIILALIVIGIVMWLWRHRNKE